MHYQSTRVVKVAGLVLLTSALLFAGGCTALVIGGGGAGGYPAAPRSDSEQASDEKISAAVRAELAADRDLAGTVIRVRTVAGIVTLEGSVANYSARSLAETLAAGIAGVRGINNRLKIANGI